MPKRRRHERRILILRLLISAVLAVLAAVMVGIIGLAFLEPCPVRETGGGAPCFRQAPWVAIAEAGAASATAAFGWWISGLLLSSRRGPHGGHKGPGRH